MSGIATSGQGLSGRPGGLSNATAGDDHRDDGHLASVDGSPKTRLPICAITAVPTATRSRRRAEIDRPAALRVRLRTRSRSLHRADEGHR